MDIAMKHSSPRKVLAKGMVDVLFISLVFAKGPVFISPRNRVNLKQTFFGSS
jgi:hypothetical protein